MDPRAAFSIELAFHICLTWNVPGTISAYWHGRFPMGLKAGASQAVKWLMVEEEAGAGVSVEQEAGLMATSAMTCCGIVR